MLLPHERAFSSANIVHDGRGESEHENHQPYQRSACQRRKFWSPDDGRHETKERNRAASVCQQKGFYGIGVDLRAALEAR